MFELEAVIGCWYQAGDYQIFEVVAVDEDEKTIEIQYVGGEVGEFELDVWRQLTLVRVSPPEEWTDAEPDSDLQSDLDINSVVWDSQNVNLDSENFVLSHLNEELAAK